MLVSLSLCLICFPTQKNNLPIYFPSIYLSNSTWHINIGNLYDCLCWLRSPCREISESLLGKLNRKLTQALSLHQTSLWLHWPSYCFRRSLDSPRRHLSILFTSENFSVDTRKISIFQYYYWEFTFIPFMAFPSIVLTAIDFPPILISKEIKQKYFQCSILSKWRF